MLFKIDDAANQAGTKAFLNAKDEQFMKLQDEIS